MLKAIILDFDGVLVDSNDVKTAAFADLFANYPPHSQDMMDYHLSHQSLPRREKFLHFAVAFMKAPPDSAQVEAIVAQMTDRYSEMVVSRVVGSPEVPGTSHFLDFFHTRCPLFLSSNTPHEELMDILKQRKITHYFQAAYGNPPVPKVKAIQNFLHEYRLDAPSVVFIGDANSDHDAARLAGIHFIGRDSGLFNRVDFPIFSDMYGVLDHLRPLVPAE